jgi:hypothetical protein
MPNMTFKSKTGMAAYVGLYLVVTAAVFYGIYYFMENDQGLYALPLAIGWFVWMALITNSGGHSQDMEEDWLEDMDENVPGTTAWMTKRWDD